MSDDLTVRDLAEELKVPSSALLEECHRLGIEGSWAGSRLEPVAVALLRDRFGASSEPPLVRKPPTRPPTTPAQLPPTAVGSLPEAAGGPAEVQGPTGPRANGVHGHGPLSHHDEIATDDTEVSKRSLAESIRRFDSTARTALIAAVIGVALVIAAPSSPHVLVTILAWLLVGAVGLVALFGGNRSRYKISTHPEKLRGMATAVVAMVVGALLLLALGAGIWVVVRSAPASAAPSLLGGRADVTELRWTFHRVARIKEGGWHRPAKDPGTCWVLPRGDEEPRDDRRVESTYRDRSCSGKHDAEVLAVFSFDRDADSAYPGSESLEAFGRKRCESHEAALTERHPDLTFAIDIEYPTEEGWQAADRDVACVALVSRTGALVD